MSLLIKGGRVVTVEDDYCADVLIEGEQVTAIGKALDVRADRVIDARGKFVLPGCVDVHTHMEVFFQGAVTCDDFTTGTEAAAFGGTTTIVDFTEPAPGETLFEGLANWHAKLERTPPFVDVGFHLIVREYDDTTAQEIRSLPREGVSSLKLFMAYKGDLQVGDDVLFEVLRAAADTGAMVMVHAENGDVIDLLVREAVRDGRTDPIQHALTRPVATESEAVGRAIALAGLAGSPLYVVHVSCAEAVEPIARARAHGGHVWGETCTQYLFIDEQDLARDGFEGAKYVFTPPPRGAADRERLWSALATDALSVISTDHSPTMFEGGKTLGRGDFSKIPNGAGGVEERMMMVHHHGVGAGRISLNRMVALLASNPAKLFGLYPRKGTIAIGGDADVVIFDPERESTLSAQTLHSRCDYSLFEGYRVRGVPEAVIVRGTIVVEDGQLKAEPGHGRYLPRTRFNARLHDLSGPARRSGPSGRTAHTANPEGAPGHLQREPASPARP